MVEVLRMRADTTPDELAFCFLVNGEDEGPRLTYAELDRQARAIAVALRDQAEPGDRAVLLYEPGLDFVAGFFGCLYGGLLAVPAYPPRLDRLAQSWQALAGITTDCRPRLALTTADLVASLSKCLVNLAGAAAPTCTATDRIDPSQAARWREPRIDPDTIAYLQYTSGSTAAPKGVMVTHRNVMHCERAFEIAVEHRGPGCGVCWAPLYHDMALVAGVLQGVFHGGLVIVMSPLAMVQRPLRWLQAISHYRADTSGGPNFAYDLCVQRVTAEEKATLDLSHWSIAGIGAEPISAQVIARFTEAFACCGFRPEAFYPTYGLAEATLLVSAGAKAARPVVRTVLHSALEQGQAVDAIPAAADARTLVGCGHAWLDQQIAIVHPESLTRCPERTVGEIWFAGPSVARGYWNRPEQTEHTFRAHLRDTGEGPFLRTGDLGFVWDGELFVTGRIKDLIVVRGRNHYPEDIETTVQSVHPGLRTRCGAAFETGQADQTRLVVVQEGDRQLRGVDLAQLLGDIRQAVAQRHELQLHDVQLLEPGSLPKTSSGKIQRQACRAGYEGGTLRLWRAK
jgi:acyl-CoA synthetase (AMP-forming)/AMP-acid ligase II